MRTINKCLFWMGLVLTVLAFLPALCLGQQAIFTYHDQLDGEMIAYILQAKHLGDGNLLPEFLSGMDKTALMPPAVGGVLLFRLFPPLVALWTLQIGGAVIGYVGMYMLVCKCTGKKIAACVAGFFYGILPFLPVYGLAQYGLPLLVVCVLWLREEPVSRVKRWLAYAYGILFALNSSLALVGFAVLALLLLQNLYDLIACKRGMKLWNTVALFAEIVFVYLLTNLTLIAQVLGLGEHYVSHKTEYALVAEHFFESLKTSFLEGGQHSVDYHLGILILAVIVLAIGVCFAEKEQDKSGSKKHILQVMIGCLCMNLSFAVIAAIWNSGVGVMLRTNFGALGAFQLDRFLWIAPCFWYLLFGCCIAYLSDKKAGVIILLPVCLVTGLWIAKNSDVKSNIQKLRNPDYPILSYSDYYALGVLDQVEAAIAQETGLAKEEYRVVSLGIDPAAALYHGFYCLDGYSNNYDLAYKHAFRQIITPALDKSDYLRAYYDEWGNRCYLFGTEAPGYYTIEKNGFYFEHLELDTKALQEMGGDYLFSAAYIANSEELNLKLMFEKPFETEDSYYRIFVYEVDNE